MSADDHGKMNAIIFSAFPDLIVLKSEMDQPELELINTTELLGNAEESLFVLLARQRDLEQIIVDPPLQTIVEPFRIRNIVNEIVSPVVDYQRCIQRLKEPNCPTIQRGRLYYHVEYYTENYTQKVPKDPEFIKFAQKLFGLFRKNLIYQKETGNYLGEGAIRDEKNGWKLTI